MQMHLYQDEKHPHVFATKKGRAEDMRQIPDRLGLELMALREQEQRVLQEINEHLRVTGQKPVS
jgi:hypothetical protein